MSTASTGTLEVTPHPRLRSERPICARGSLLRAEPVPAPHAMVFLRGLHLTRKLAAHKLRKSLDFALHLRHFFPHVQDDFDAGEIDAHFPSERENYLEPVKVGIGVEARVPSEREGLSKPTRS